jgi:ketosteroid isomerase-like protein
MGVQGNSSSSGPSPIDVLSRLRQSIDEHDLDALADCFALDYVNETPLHPSRGFTGRDQVRRNWSEIFSGVPDISAAVIRATVDGSTAWSEWEMHGTRRDGSPFAMAGVGIFEIRDGRATHCRFYLDPVDPDQTGIDDSTRRIVRGSDARRSDAGS